MVNLLQSNIRLSYAIKRFTKKDSSPDGEL